MKNVEVQWGPIICNDCESCICSTRVEYKKESDSTYTLPNSSPNPTQKTTYTLNNIEEGVTYKVKLTFIGPQCKEKTIIVLLELPAAASQCCPDGFTSTADGSGCYKVEDINATPPSGGTVNLVNVQANAYSACGSYIYENGYNINGTGAATKIPVITDVPSGQPSTLWTNGDGNCLLGDGFSSLGPLNRTGVWTVSPQANQDIGFGICLDLPETKTYYVSIGSDNYGIISLDGTVIISQDATALGTQYGVGPAAAFKVFHIYPVTMSAGPHILEIKGHNVSSSATIGCEVYNATADQLRACTNLSMLTPYTLFTSQSKIGQQVQLGTGGVGYTCPPDYSLAPCAGQTPMCRKITTADYVDC